MRLFVVLRATPFLSERMGQTGINIVCLILAAIAAEFIVNGVRELFPNLA